MSSDIHNDHLSSAIIFTIRPCKLEDEPAARAVCLYTGDAGNDASTQYQDPHVLGYRYVSPYIHFSPELAFVLEDSHGNICGYVLATLQSDRFYQWYVNDWLSKMRAMYPTIPTDMDETKKDRLIIESFHHDQLESFPLFDDYPSHLHIDLLPRAQSQGNGTKMIHHLEQELKRQGSKGVHLGMAPNNVKAFRFYTKLGFQVLREDPDTLWLGKRFH